MIFNWKYKYYISLFVFHFILHQSRLVIFYFFLLIKQLRFKMEKKKNQTQFDT